MRTYNLYGEVEFYSPDELKLFLDESGGADVTVYINSFGGEVFAGQSMHNMLARYKGKKTVVVDGVAASIASVIAMAGDEIHIHRNSMLMIHNPSTMCWGDSEEMLQKAATLEKVKESILQVYVARTKLDKEVLSNMMDSETWLNADEAMDLGFADKVLESGKRYTDLYDGRIVARFKNAPKTAGTPSTLYEMMLQVNKNKEW